MIGPIIVAGESLVDLIVDAQGGLRHALGGGPYTTARTIGRLGGRVAFLGSISVDRFGVQLLRGLTDAGVDTGCTAQTDAPTTLALAELDDGGAARYRFYVDGTAAPQLDRAWVVRALERRPSALHLGTLGLVFEPIGSSLEELASELPDGAWLMLDPNARPSATPDLAVWRARIRRICALASVVRVTTDDLAVLHPELEPIAAAEVVADLGPQVVLLTNGAGTVRILMAGQPAIELPVPPVAVVDTVGSGDAFGGAFLAWWQAHGLGRGQLRDPALIEAATSAAIRVAGVTCTRPGADPPTLQELGGWD